ncbi:MAG: hypothetical protein R3D86_00490 [Emcibacteraceae bacterium]
MALNNFRAKKPVIFGRKKQVVGDSQDDDTLDMLLHYAKAGMEYAEQSLKDSPELFSPAEIAAFDQNKNMLEQAPYLINSYKSKMAEYDALHKKMIGILRKCEEIVAAGDEQAKQEINKVLKEAKVFSYNEDGDLVLKRGVS